MVEEETNLDSESTVDLRLALVVFPDDTELNDTFRDLDDVQCLLVCRVGLQKGNQALREL